MTHGALIPGSRSVGAQIGAFVTQVDDGDFAPTSGAATSSHTWSSLSSTGPTTVIIVTWRSNLSPRTLNSATFDGINLIIAVQDNQPTAFDSIGSAILIVSGTFSSKSLVLNWSGTMSDSHITVLSLANLISLTPKSTDFNHAPTGNGDPLIALNDAGAKGITIAGFGNRGSTSAISWANAVERSDLDAGAFRHSCATQLGLLAGDIDATGSSNDHAIVGASFR